ncbi:MAG: hypothetical protein HOV80_07650 [Polyangiaceae bacterium]|nr:hypothetical protein [Polyangiaceae bacterium]
MLVLPGLGFAALGASCAFEFPDYELTDMDATSTAAGAGGGTGGSVPAPFAADGQPCDSSWECFSGNCLPNNTAPGNICCANACPEMDATTCGTNGKCDASGADCALYPAGRYCGDTACQDGMITIQQCYAASCTQSDPIPCGGGLECSPDGSTCKTSCTSEDDCISPGNANPQCENGQCTDRPPGAECDDNAQCASNRCGVAGTGHCCAVSCGPAGETCSATDCDTTGQCMYPATDTPCGADPSCESSNVRSQYCDGDGTCGSESTQQCPGHLGCENPMSCYSSCGSNDATGDQRCAPGHWCDGSTCHAASWDESGACLRDGQCRSNDCTAAGFCAAPDCDFDQDGQLRADLHCGGNDCDDSDARVWPGQDEFFDTPRASGGYDFNCDGIDEGNHATGCACGGQALVVPPGVAGCSVTGPIISCYQIFLFCGANGTGVTATQLCR